MQKMDLRQMLRNRLLKEEEKKREYKYGVVMLYFEFKSDSWNKIQNMIVDEDVYHGPDESNPDPAYGREDEPHLTLLYGLHADVTNEDVEKILNKFGKPTDIKLLDITTFDNSKTKGFEVVKFDVKGDELHDINKALSKLPHTTDFPDYHPHMTIAYTKPGTSKKYSKTLNNDEIPEVISTKVIYKKPNGEKKEYNL